MSVRDKTQTVLGFLLCGASIAISALVPGWELAALVTLYFGVTALVDVNQ